MANIKSAKKRVLVIAKKTSNNKSKKSALKTAEKSFLALVNEGNKEVASESFRTLEKKIMQASASNLLHANAASRKVSRLAKRLNSMAE
ncbi:MAG: 30S ribosomal protein S20 [Acidaminobacteraceae bacterium]